MSVLEENKAIIRRFISAYNERNLAVFEELVAADYVDHTHQQKGRRNSSNCSPWLSKASPTGNRMKMPMVFFFRIVEVKLAEGGEVTTNWTSSNN
jgi:C-1 hydroxylase